MTEQPKRGWLAGSLIFFMPVILILFLGSQMAYSQGQGRFAYDQSIPEVTTLAEMRTIPPADLVILRGQIAAAFQTQDSDANATGLVVFQERPADGREIRFREEFPSTFPALILQLPDGNVEIEPSDTGEQVIQAEPHSVRVGDRVHTGFRAGDIVSIQGIWQPEPATLLEVSGITSISQATRIAEWQQDFRYVGWARNGLGGLSLLCLIVFFVHLRRVKSRPGAGQGWSKAHV